MQIVLARHGKPRLNQGSWIAPHQLANWILAYDEGGVVVADASVEVCTRAAESGLFVSSPLLRCVESARALAPSRDIDFEELIREAGLPHPLWDFPRLPVAVWLMLFRAAWFCRYSANSESLAAARSRAGRAANRLIELAAEHQSVFVMGHGIMTRLIARELVMRGWQGPSRPAPRYWHFGVYRKSAE
jgi:broad specificity phosphatase PhoE